MTNKVQIAEFAAYNHLFFTDWNILKIALTHSSFSNENGRVPCNERLEYLGDAVLQLIISDYLYRNCVQQNEGFLTKVRSLIVREETLAQVAESLKISEYLLLGFGEQRSGGADNPANLADAVEAVIGAIYLDQGFDKARLFVLERFSVFIEQAVNGKLVYDFKSKLHELAQKRNAVLDFVLISIDGPAHNASFCVNCLWNNQVMGVGRASSKKQAEQQAAAEVLKSLGV